MMLLNTKRISTIFLLSGLCIGLAMMQSCKKKKRSEMANELYSATKNNVFKNVTPEAFDSVFRKVMVDENSKLDHADAIKAYYEQNDYDPIFVMDHLFNNDLTALTGYLQKANEHGIDPKQFKGDEINALIKKFRTKNGIKTMDEAYHDMAELELLSANSLISYSTALEYGLVNPKKIFSRYFTQTLLPDSTNITRVFTVKNIPMFLDSIQPKDPQYVALQKALATNVTAQGMSQEETKRVLLVNLERLRWKNKPTQKKFVWVNIPDYHLDVMDSGKSVLGMKVCVGEGRNKDNANTLEHYSDTCIKDRPFRKETPLLNSMIHSAQVNPIWNIPQSIVSREIIKAASDDPYYLSNKGINVYKNGHKIESEEIDWKAVTSDNSAYEFKQAPGADNSLGKIKFLFNNKSNVYLHDTPAKSAFDLAERDVSHGCVRLEKPLDFAHTLFGDGSKFAKIQKDMGEDNPEPENLTLSPKVPVYISYMTCWADESGTLQFRKDVYGLDIVLYDRIKKFLS